jgi:hypothetical protein
MKQPPTKGLRKRDMQFYNLKTRSHVEVPDSAIKKTKMVRKTKNGEQVRYALKAVHDGAPLFKFVNEATFNSLNVPEE